MCKTLRITSEHIKPLKNSLMVIKLYYFSKESTLLMDTLVTYPCYGTTKINLVDCEDLYIIGQLFSQILVSRCTVESQ